MCLVSWAFALYFVLLCSVLGRFAFKLNFQLINKLQYANH